MNFKLLKKSVLLFLMLFIIHSSISSQTIQKNSDEIFLFQNSFGKNYGFFINEQGYYLTDSKFLKNSNGGYILYSKNIKLKAYIKHQFNIFPTLEGFSILKTDLKPHYNVQKMGDSDTVDNGDEIRIFGLKKGKILYKLQNFNNYRYPCFISDIKTKKSDSGKPVYNINNKVIGLFIVYYGNHLIIPINRIKKNLTSLFYKEATSSIPSTRFLYDEKLFSFKTVDKELEENNDDFKEDFVELKAKKTYQIGNSFYHFASIKDMAFDQNNNLYVIDGVFNQIKKIPFEKIKSQSFNNKNDKDKSNNLLSLDKFKKIDNLQNTNFEQSNLMSKNTLISEKKNKNNSEMRKISKTNKLNDKTNIHKNSFISIQLNLPTSLAVTHEGLLYVLDHGEKKVLIFNSQLERIGDLDYSAISNRFKPDKIRSFKNEVFVLSKFKRLYSLQLDKISGQTIARPVFLEKEKWKNSMIEDITYHRNKLYLLDLQNNKIRQIEKKQQIKEFSISSSITTMPTSLAVYGNHIYIFDRLNSKIGIYNLEGDFIHNWNANLLYDNGSPILFSISFSGLIAVAYRDYSHIRIFKPNGRLLNILSSFSSGAKQLVEPLSLSVSDSEEINIVNDKSCIVKINSNSEAQVNYLSNYFDISYRGITRNDSGELLISNTFHDQIICINPKKINFENNLNKIKYFHQYKQPVQLASFGDLIYILDKENHRVVVTNNFRNIKKIILLKDKKNILRYPQDITVNNKGNFFVLAENSVLHYDNNFKLINDFNIKEGLNSYMGFAKGIAFFKDKIYISDTYHHQILIYNLKGQFLESFGQIGYDLDDFYYPWDIIAQNDAIYISDKGNHRIVKYSVVQNMKLQNMRNKSKKEISEVFDTKLIKK